MRIQFKDLTYIYSPDMPFKFTALNNVSGEFKVGSFNAIVGPTGSGKSTLIQNLNGLLRPTSGSLEVLEYTIVPDKKTKELKKLRSKVGLVFQFPEMQLFEETVYKDVAFGPKNFGFSDDEIKANVENSLTLVGIDKELWEKSPLELSGGQKRRVAIAGVLASNPEVLILDEPTAGLDPMGTQEIMNLFEILNKEHGKTIIMVTHNMNHVLNYSDYILALNHGEVLFNGDTQTFFESPTYLDELGFLKPDLTNLTELLKKYGYMLKYSKNLKDLIIDFKEQYK